MKKLLITVKDIISRFTGTSNAEVISNERIDQAKVDVACKIIAGLYKDVQSYTKDGSGPFVAAIYNDKNELVVKAANSVVNEGCSINHAEMNVIRAAEQMFGTYDLAPYNLKLYLTAEPCIMCVGGIMWSGIKEIYYGVPSKAVEKITGFDEGFKPNWFKEFKKRGIVVYGNIEQELGKQELQNYVNEGKKIYKPLR